MVSSTASALSRDPYHHLAKTPGTGTPRVFAFHGTGGEEIAAITSAIGCLEPVVATCADLLGTSRARAVVYSLTAIFVAGIPTFLPHGHMS